MNACSWCGKTDRPIAYTDVLDLDWCVTCFQETYLENWQPDVPPEEPA